MKKKAVLYAVTLCSMTMCCVVPDAFGNAYKILCVKSAKATAMGEAFIVQADDPSTIAFNPAGLVQVEGTQVSLQGTLCNAYTTYKSPSGDKSHNVDQWQLVPSFFVTSDFGVTNFGSGFGITFPNGLASEWAEDSFARYVATYSDLKVMDVSPAFGVRLWKRLMLGGGLDFYYSKARLDRMADMGVLFGAPGQMDVKTSIEGDGTAWGFNVGSILEITPHHSVAITYHYPYTINYDGTFKFGDDKYDMSTSIDFPEVIVFGYAWRPTQKWTVEFNADWTHWDTVGNINVDIKDPYMQDAVIESKYENTFAYKFGAQYAWSEDLDLRCGYLYNENATPDETWSPSQPDTDIHFFTAGFGYALGRTDIEGAFQLVYYEERTIDNNVSNNENTSSSTIDGTYKTWAPCFTLAATYHF